MHDCIEWQLGECKYGDNCKYKHDPSTKGKGHENGLTTRLAAMAAMPCHAFAVGKCRWGDKCRYKHSGESEVKVGLGLGLGLGLVGSGEGVQLGLEGESARLDDAPTL